MADMLKCEIVTPVQTVFESDATYVALPGEMGGFGVMRRHEPLVSALAPGTVSVTVPGSSKESKASFVVSGGYAQISDDKVIVLANDALDVKDIDANAVRAEIDKIEKTIAGLKDGDASIAYYKGQKAWFELQLHTVSGE